MEPRLDPYQTCNVKLFPRESFTFSLKSSDAFLAAWSYRATPSPCVEAKRQSEWYVRLESSNHILDIRLSERVSVVDTFVNVLGSKLFARVEAIAAH